MSDKKTQSQIEHQHQKHFIEWCERSYGAYPELRRISAVPNGIRYAGIGAAVKARNEGVRKGVLDLFLDVARGGHHGWRMEFKAPGGRLSVSQAIEIIDLRREHYYADFCFDWEECKNNIEHYLKLDKPFIGMLQWREITRRDVVFKERSKDPKKNDDPMKVRRLREYLSNGELS